MKSIRLPHPNCYQVPESRLLAGEYPFTPEPRSAREKIRAFLDAGVTFFVDLTQAHELDPYSEALHEESSVRGIDVRYLRLPIPDMDVPEPARMSEILDTIDTATAEGRMVYVHCWGGVGRTGTVVGCYLVRRGFAPDEALERVRRLFCSMSPQKVGAHRGFSPQTRAQCEFVRSWPEGKP